MIPHKIDAFVQLGERSGVQQPWPKFSSCRSGSFPFLLQLEKDCCTKSIKKRFVTS